MSDSDRAQLAYIEETGSYGVTPVGNLTRMRFTTESLKQNAANVRSAEIRNDRQTPSIIRTSATAAGDTNVELSYSSHDDLLQAALLSAAWSGIVTIGPGATFSAAAADQSFNDSANGLAGLAVSQWIKVSGFATAANNGFFKIVTKAAGKITVKGGSAALINEAAGPAVTIVMGGQIVNGVTGKSFSIEKKFTDLVNIYSVFKGMMINGLNLSIVHDQVLAGGFSWMGKSEASAAATIGTGYVAQNTNNVLSAIDNVKGVLDNYSNMDILSMDLALGNNLHNRMIVGTLGPISIGKGNVSLSGSIRSYFETVAHFDKYLNWTTTALAAKIQDSTGSAYIIDMPAVKLIAGGRPTPGQNQDIIADMNWEAYMDPTEQITLRIARFV